MKVILLQKIRKVGGLGDIVDVKPGYARNYLIPQGKASRATKENQAMFQTKRLELEKIEQESLAKAQKRAEQLKDLTLTIAHRALEEGKLFGSIGLKDIFNALIEKGISVEKREINMTQGTIRDLGEYEVELQLHSDVNVKIKVSVVAA
jgi:large subunit ribosomal protein L9